MKSIIFAIAAFAMVGVLATATPADAGRRGHGHHGGGYEQGDGEGGYGHRGRHHRRYKSETPEVVETPDRSIDPWLLEKNRALAKELPTAKVKRLCVGKNPDDFHKDIGGITLDPHHWTPLECVRARFERIEAMMGK